MKTKLLLLLVTVLTSTTFYAQCSRSGTFVANSPNTMTYPIAGNANITQDATGVSINFESTFASVQGFKLALYLSTTQDIDTDPSSNPNPTTFIRVDLEGELVCDEHSSSLRSHNMEAMEGAQKFTQNLATVNLNDYQYIILQCIEFHVPWGYVNLGAASSGCALSLKENTLANNLSFAPNPATSNITISNAKQLDLLVSVIDLLGKTVIQTKNSSLSNQSINLESLKSGVYLLQINSNGNRLTKKLVKK